MNRRQVIPCGFTAVALAAGVFSMLRTLTGDYLAAAQFIMLAMVLDGMDGVTARLLKGTSSFGAELDTFVDLTSFGVAPALLAYATVLRHWGIWGLGLTAWIVLSGAIRLSRFRLADPHRGQHGYLGLPITCCAGWLALMVFITESGLLSKDYFVLRHGPFAVFGWIGVVVMLVLQVSHVRYTKPTKELIVFVPCVFFVLLLFLQRPVAVSAALAMMAYGFVYAFVTPLLSRHGVTLDIEEEDEEESVPVHHS